MSTQRAETRRVDIGVALSLLTGKVLCPFAEMQETAEWLLGRPIWTHEFGDRETVRLLQGAIIVSAPQLSMETGECVSRDNWRDYVQRCANTYGSSVALMQHVIPRTENPLESLLRMMESNP